MMKLSFYAVSGVVVVGAVLLYSLQIQFSGYECEEHLKDTTTKFNASLSMALGTIKSLEDGRQQLVMKHQKEKEAFEQYKESVRAIYESVIEGYQRNMTTLDRERQQLLQKVTEKATESTPARASAQPESSTKYRQRIDFKSCRSDRPLITANVDFRVGTGHKMSQWWWVFHLAVTKGYCICFQPKIDQKLWELLVQPLFNECPTADDNKTIVVTLQSTDPKNTYSMNVIHDGIHNRIQQYIIHNATTYASAPHLFVVYPEISHTWGYRFKTDKSGFGDVLQFADNMMQPSGLLSNVVQPWYLTHRKHSRSAFLQLEQDVVNLAVHLRVGDAILEFTQSYWENLFVELGRIIQLEFGTSRRTHLYLVYFKGDFRFDASQKGTAAYGEWTGTDEDLPSSHSYLSSICSNHSDWVTCHWKTGSGTSMDESIDCMVQSDVVYTSGSSFAQILGFFNPNVKVVAVAKDLNYHGDQTHIPFWTSHATVLTSSRYYYVNVNGSMYAEQEAFLHLPNKR